MRHTRNRRIFFNNLATLTEHYGIDTNDVQFVAQDYYHKFDGFHDTGQTIWKKISIDKKRIVWLNPNNGFAIAALRDLDYELKPPNENPTLEENLSNFKSLWLNLDYDLKLLYENIENHIVNDEYCCISCHFPFATVCSELYSQFIADYSHS